MGCMLTARLQHRLGHWVWTNIVMHIRQPFVCDNGDPAIVCINQVIDDDEAHLYKIQSQLYSSHIARSPEFLGQQGTSPQHTITHVPVEGGSSYQQHTFVHGQQPAGTDVMYQVDMLATSSQVTGNTGGMQSGERPSLVQQRSSSTMYTDSSSSEYSSGSPTERQQTESKQAFRADVLNRLKRKMSESSNTSQCRPRKVARVSACDNQGGSPSSSGSVGYQASALITNMSLFAGNGGDFSMGNSDIQFVAPAQEGPVYQQLHEMKKNIVIAQNEGIVNVVTTSLPMANTFNQPPTPLTPDSLTSEYISEFTPDVLTIDVTGNAVVPTSMLTPDASPVSHVEVEVSSSPQPHTDPSLEYNTNLPALDEFTFFEEVTEKAQEKSKMPMMMHLPKAETRRLPVIDPMMMEQMLIDLEDSPAVTPPICAVHPPTPAAQVQDAADMARTESPRIPENDELFNQVTSVLMDFMQHAAPGGLDLSQLMVIPQDFIDQHRPANIQPTLAENDNLSGFGSIVEMTTAAINDELGFSLDELHQLTSELDMPLPSYGRFNIISLIISM